MDRVEAPEVLDRKACGSVQQQVVQLHKLDPFEDRARAGSRRRPVMADRPHDLDVGESARGSSSPAPDERAEGRRLWLAHGKLHECR